MLGKHDHLILHCLISILHFLTMKLQDVLDIESHSRIDKAGLCEVNFESFKNFYSTKYWSDKYLVSSGSLERNECNC